VAASRLGYPGAWSITAPRGVFWHRLRASRKFATTQEEDLGELATSSAALLAGAAFFAGAGLISLGCCTDDKEQFFQGGE